MMTAEHFLTWQQPLPRGGGGGGDQLHHTSPHLPIPTPPNPNDPTKAQLPWSRCCRLLISSQSAPASYMKTAKRHLRDSGGLVLCGLGDALANVVTLAELLKTQDLAQIDLILTGLQSVDGQARWA